MSNDAQYCELIALLTEMATASETGIAHDWHGDVEIFAQELLYIVASSQELRV